MTQTDCVYITMAKLLNNVIVLCYYSASASDAISLFIDANDTLSEIVNDHILCSTAVLMTQSDCVHVTNDIL